MRKDWPEAIEREGMLSNMETLRAEKAELRAEIERLRALLKRHDALCVKDEETGADCMWTPELQELVEDTRAALAHSPEADR